MCSHPEKQDWQATDRCYSFAAMQRWEPAKPIACILAGVRQLCVMVNQQAQQAQHPCAPAHARDRITSPLQPPNARILLQALLGQYQPVLVSTSQPHFTPQCQ